jgi:hypothetical protein
MDVTIQDFFNSNFSAKQNDRRTGEIAQCAYGRLPASIRARSKAERARA